MNAEILADESPRAAGINGSAPGTYTETADIRRDLDALRDSVGALTRHLQSDGKAKASEVKAAVNEGISSLLDKSEESMKAVDGQVKENPRGALAVAFCAGILVNILLRKG